MNIELLTTQLNNGFYQITETGKSFSNKTLNGNKPGSIGFKLTDKNNNEIYVGGWNTESANIYNTAICLNDVNSEIHHLTLGKNNVEKNTLNVTNTKLLSTTQVNNKVKNSNCSVINLSIDNDNIQIPKYTSLLYIPADASEESYAYLLSDTSLDIDPETEQISEKNLKFMPDHSIEYNGKKTKLTWQNIELPPDDSNMPRCW